MAQSKYARLWIFQSLAKNSNIGQTFSPTLAHDAIEQLVREEWGKLLASLITHLGDFQLAEDSLQDALESSLHHWQRYGLPRTPAAWLLQTARRKAIDRLRRNANFKTKSSQIAYETNLNNLMEIDANEMALTQGPEIPDERLALIFTCCHPAIEKKSRIALTLHTLGGLTTSEIAHAFLDTQSAMAQRLVRAKRKIKHAAIPYSVPSVQQWPERLQAVLEVIYLIFNEGYYCSNGLELVRKNLCEEALRLSRILCELKPDEPEIEGLLALILLHDSRRSSRQDEKGQIIALQDQDRTIWDKQKIATGLDILNQALNRKSPGPFQIQAAISAVHAEAMAFEETNWVEIVALYEHLYHLQPTPVVALNKIVAISHAQGTAIACDMLQKLEDPLAEYQPFYATKADFLQTLGRINEAEIAYLKAIDLTGEENIRRFLQQKLGKMLRRN